MKKVALFLVAVAAMLLTSAQASAQAIPAGVGIDGNLVFGTGGGDVIVVLALGNRAFVIAGNGQGFVGTADISSGLQIEGREGNDIILVIGNANLDVTVDGGDGMDTFILVGNANSVDVSNVEHDFGSGSP